MFFSIISPQNPPKLVIWNTKIPTREQNFPTNGLLGGALRPPSPPIGFGPVHQERSDKLGLEQLDVSYINVFSKFPFPTAFGSICQLICPNYFA